MNILKEIALNQLMRVGFVRNLAKRRHCTGINADADYVNRVYETYFAGMGLSGKEILEIGPGHTFQIMQKARENGASGVTIIDIEKYLSSSDVQKHSIDYRIYNGTVMPFSEASFDIVCSHTVFEHLRDATVTVNETYRVLKPGGISVHVIDLQDHFFFGVENPRIFNCLRYSNRVWKAMTFNRSTFVNRLRYSDWIALFEEAGFAVEKCDAVFSALIRELYRSRKVDYLQRFNEMDATAMHMTVHLRKPVLR
jgi:ubiquinone/menaquinone biosynthesis C-methylase UbiE